jgi:hypothetical protein
MIGLSAAVAGQLVIDTIELGAEENRRSMLTQSASSASARKSAFHAGLGKKWSGNRISASHGFAMVTLVAAVSLAWFLELSEPPSVLGLGTSTQRIVCLVGLCLELSVVQSAASRRDSM